MVRTAFDTDTVLTDFLTKYLDNQLENGEQQAFEEYLEKNEREHTFARKAHQGKKILNRFASQLRKEDDLSNELAQGSAF